MSTFIFPITVLYYDHTAALGGGEIALINLIKALDRRHILPKVLLSEDGPAACQLRALCETHILPWSKKISTIRRNSLGLSSLGRIREAYELSWYTLKVARFVRHNDVDIIHTNSLKSDIVGGIAGLLAHRPVVWHVRDRIDSDYLPARVVKVFRRLSSWIPRYVLANSYATLATLQPRRKSQDGQWLRCAHTGTNSKVVHDGLDLDDFDCTSAKDGPPTIALIGRICAWKGQHVFIQAAKTVSEVFPNAQFKIFGSALFGEEKYEREIHLQRAQLGLDETVEFCGFKTNIAAELEKLTLLVHASTIGEPFGQVIIEGMAACKPVVATAGGGVPEIVINGLTGLIIPMGDANAMAEAICQLLSDPERAVRMGQQGYARVRDCFTIQQTARSIQAVYCSLLEQK